MNFLVKTARFLSTLFSPLLMGTYGILLSLWLSYLCYSSFHTKAIVVAITFVATCIIPVIAIFCLYKAGVVKDPGLNERTERTIPFIVTLICYLGVGIYYHLIHAPVWLSMFMLGGAVALGVLTVVSRKWKISGHATGVGGLCAMLFYLMCSGNSVDNIQPEFIVAVLIAGCVCTSRLILERHTLMQVAAGFLNGFVCVFLPAWFFGGIQPVVF